VIYATSEAPVLTPGEIVVVQLDPGAPEALGVIVIATGQLIEDAVRTSPRARVIRIASEDDLVALQNEASHEVGLARSAATKLVAAGMPPEWDTWLSTAGAEPAVTLAKGDETSTAGQFIQRRFADSESFRRPLRGDPKASARG